MWTVKCFTFLYTFFFSNFSFSAPKKKTPKRISWGTFFWLRLIILKVEFRGTSYHTGDIRRKTVWEHIFFEIWPCGTSVAKTHPPFLGGISMWIAWGQKKKTLLVSKDKWMKFKWAQFLTKLVVSKFKKVWKWLVKRV